jgi:hypothetical protein
MDRRRRDALGVGAALATALLLPVGVSATVKHDPASEIALDELLWMPRSVSGSVCLHTPGREMEYLLTTVSHVSRLHKRGVRLDSYMGDCDRPATVLRVEKQAPIAGCAGRVIVEWWLMPRGWVPSMRLRKQVYESERVSRVGRYRALAEEGTGPCTDRNARHAVEQGVQADEVP